MNVDRMVFAFAGAVVLMGLMLGLLVHQYWFFLTGFAGLNMFQAAFTGFCPVAKLFKMFGANVGPAFH